MKLLQDLKNFTNVNSRKIVAQNSKQEQIKLEKDLKLLEKNLNTPKDIENSDIPKNRVENIYEHISKGIKIKVKK